MIIDEIRSQVKLDHQYYCQLSAKPSSKVAAFESERISWVLHVFVFAILDWRMDYCGQMSTLC